MQSRCLIEWGAVKPLTSLVLVVTGGLWKSELNKCKCSICFLFNQYEMLLSSADKVKCFARLYYVSVLLSTHQDYLYPIFFLELNIYCVICVELRSCFPLSSSNLTAHEACKLDDISLIVLKICATELTSLPILSDLYNRFLVAFQIVENSIL